MIQWLRRQWINKKADNATSVPQTLSSRFEENQKLLRTIFDLSQDVKMIEKNFVYPHRRSKALLIYCDMIVNKRRMIEALPAIESLAENLYHPSVERKNNTLPWSLPIGKTKQIDELIQYVFSGFLVILFEGKNEVFCLNIADFPQRSVEETNAEISIRGPRDGFTEDLRVNVALIRKRLKTESLAYEEFIVGKRSKTQIGLLYIKDIIYPEYVETIKKRIKEIDIDLISSSAKFEELIADRSYSLFPAFNYTGRPDFAANALVRGRFCIIIDGLPTILIGPTNLINLMKSGEDNQFLFIYPSFEFIFRLLGIIVTLLLPGLWIALAGFHQDQIPYNLLATLVESRRGVPFPIPVESFIMLFLFELFREAGMRLPLRYGQTFSVVGGLIIGDAAIRFGLTSAGTVVVMAAAIVANSMLVNQSLVGTTAALRVYIMLCSSFLGMLGFLTSYFTVVLYLAHYRPLGVPYLAPVSPFIWKDFFRGILRPPTEAMNERPKWLKVRDHDRQGSKS